MTLAPEGRSAFKRLAVLSGTASAGVVCGYLVGVSPVLIVVPLLVAVPVVLWKWPHYGVIFLVAAATEIEEFTYTIGTHKGFFTSSIPLWRSFMHGMLVLPIELLILLMIILWTTKGVIEGTFMWPRTPLVRVFGLLWMLLLVALGVGMSHGAQLKIQMYELRPWFYLTVGFFLTASLLRTRKALDGILWAFILGSGIKGVEGTYLFFAYARSMRPRPEEVLGHEEAWFFSVFIVICAALWLYRYKGRMRTISTALLPFVVIADMANSRRVAWLILSASILVVLVIGHRTMPERRKVLRRLIVILALSSAVYVPAYWNHTGTLAQPARAVKSAISPSSRDQSSDVYRQQENVNLILNIKSSSLLGRGFGVPIEYTATIVNISGIDSMIAFIPHDGILWVWMRMGMQGEIVLWVLISVAIIRGARLVRCRDPRLSMFGLICTCSTVGWVLMGYNDMGFAWFRIAIAMGCLLGAMESATRFAAGLEIEETDRTDTGFPMPATRDMVQL